MPVKIFAMPKEGSGQQYSGGKNVDLLSMAQRYNHEPIRAFESLDDLFAKILRILEAKNWDCLQRLEIAAHGSPWAFDGLYWAVFLDTIDDFGDQMRAIEAHLCDNVQVYLKGCNTGVTDNIFGIEIDPLARDVAQAIPFTPGVFEHRVIIFGTRGYSEQGTSRMRGDIRVTRTGSNGDLPAYPGSDDATGRRAWRGFRNWM